MKTKKAVNRSYKVLNLSQKAQDSLQNRSNRVNKAYEASRNDLIPEAEHLANIMVKDKDFDASQQILKQEYWSEQFMMAMDVLAHEKLGVTCSWIERAKEEGKYAGNRN